MKNKYEIFPDYFSTGVWLIHDNGHSSSELPKYVPKILDIALKEWHNVWEFLLADYSTNGDVCTMSDRFIINWYYNGKSIVEELNKLGVDEYIYKTDSLDMLSLEVDLSKCKKCYTTMVDGLAMGQTYTGMPDFIGDDTVCTISPGGSGNIIPCKKCPNCGWSTT